MQEILFQCVRAMVHATELNSLLQTICGLLSETGYFSVVAVTLFGAKTDTDAPLIVCAGCDEEAFKEIGELWAHIDQSNNPTIDPSGSVPLYHLHDGSAHLKTPSIQGTKTLSNAIVRLSIPLYSHNQAIGNLHFYANTIERFDSVVIESLVEFATDFTCTVVALRNYAANEKAEHDLAKYKQIVSSTPDGISLLDRDYRYVILNDAYETFSAKKRENLIGLTVPEYLGQEVFEQYIKDHFDRCLGGEVIQFQEWFEYPTLGRRFVQVTYYPYVDTDQVIAGVVANSRDLTAQKLAEEERENLQMQLLQSQKMELLGRLAGGIAHDYNNMLAIILMRTELALMMHSELPPKLVDSLHDIERAARHSADLTRQLLGFARKQLITPTPVNLNDAISSMVSMLRRLIGSSISVAWMPADDLWTIHIDPGQITQVLTNLCVNSRDAIDGVGHILIETHNLVGNAPVDDYVVLSVSDTGCGMDEATIAHMFEPFFTTKGIGQGIGLGLATVYGIVKQNKGYIDVQSTVGAGTTVSIYFPRYKREAEPTIDIYDQPLQQHKTKKTILLVEDEPELLILCQEILQQLGYRVLLANSPSKALAYFQTGSETIHLVITDVVMPEMNGVELIKHLRVRVPELKWLYMSGYTSDVVLQQGADVKEHHFLAKPFSMKELAAKVQNILEK
jgi:two-component system cell cycle sensor histidine kinase/response regulator CckA